MGPQLLTTVTPRSVESVEPPEEPTLLHHSVRLAAAAAALSCSVLASCAWRALRQTHSNKCSHHPIRHAVPSHWLQKASLIFHYFAALSLFIEFLPLIIPLLQASHATHQKTNSFFHFEKNSNLAEDFWHCAVPYRRRRTAVLCKRCMLCVVQEKGERSSNVKIL